MPSKQVLLLHLSCLGLCGGVQESVSCGEQHLMSDRVQHAGEISGMLDIMQHVITNIIINIIIVIF